MTGWILFAAEESAHHHKVPAWVTGLFMVLLVLMIAALALEEKLHAKKSIIVGGFAGLCLLLVTFIDEALDEIQILPFGKIHPPFGEPIPMPVYIPAIDWSVITIILGASLFVEVTSRSGVFTWMAIKLTKKSGGDPFRLLIAYGLLTVLFSAVLNNVTAMIIIGSLTTVSLKKLRRTDLLLGFLLIEGLLTNVGGLLTLISSVPNIIVGNTQLPVEGGGGKTEPVIGFVEFFLYAAPYVVVATAATIFLGKVLFGIHGLKSDEEREDARKLVAGFDETESIPSARFFWFSVGALAAFILSLSAQSVLPGFKELGMGFVALFFAGVVLLAYRSEVNKFYAAIDWDLLAFFAALFVVINVMEHTQVLALIGRGIGALLTLPNPFDSSVLLAASALASSVTDNIPLAAVLAKILKANGTPADSSYWWCVIFGANLGGNITPIGSASTVVAMTIIHREKLPLTFTGFVIKAIPFALLQLVLAIGYVLIA